MYAPPAGPYSSAFAPPPQTVATPGAAFTPHLTAHMLQPQPAPVYAQAAYQGQIAYNPAMLQQAPQPMMIYPPGVAAPAMQQPAVPVSNAPAASSTSTAPASVSLTPELTSDETSWLSYVRHHDLLPYIDNKTAATSAAAGGNSASTSSSNLGLTAAPLSPKSFNNQLLSSSSSGLSVGGGERNKSNGFALVINKVSGIRIPPHVEAREQRSNLRFRIQVSFFDTLNKRFFGRTWVGPLQSLSGNSTTMGNQQVLYYRSSLHSEFCVAIVEYVLCVVKKQAAASGGEDEDVVLERYAIGWTVLTLFSRDLSSLTDVNDPQIDLEESIGDLSLQTTMFDLNPSASAAQLAVAQSSKLKRKQLSKKLWAGTPRAMLFMEPLNCTSPSAGEWTKKLTQALGQAAGNDGMAAGSGLTGNVTVYYELFLCRALHPFFHLFREFEILGPNDILSGLPLEPSTNAAKVQRKFGFAHGACLPQNPKLLPKLFLPLFGIKIISPSLLVPARFETRMLDALTAIKIIQWGGADLDSNQAPAPLERSIAGRTLVVGLHNGRRYLKPPVKLPLVAQPAVPAQASNAGQAVAEENPNAPLTLFFQGDFSLPDLACAAGDDPAVALVFELHYEIRWHKVGMPQHPLNGNFVAGWTISLINGSPARIHLDGRPQTLILQRGPGRTLNHERVYGFMDEGEESRRNTGANLLALTLAIQASGMGGRQAESRQQVDMVSTSVPITTSAAAAAAAAQQQLATQQQFIAAPAQVQPAQVPSVAQMQTLQVPASSSTVSRPLSPAVTFFPQQQAQQQQAASHAQQLQSFDGSVSFLQGVPQQQVVQQTLVPLTNTQSFANLPVQPYQVARPLNQATVAASGMQLVSDAFVQPALGLSVGIQTGPELLYDPVLGDDGSGNMNNSRSFANAAGTTQGYSKVVGGTAASRAAAGGTNALGRIAGGESLTLSGGSGQATTNIFGKPVNLARELVDPLKVNEFLLSFTSFAQTQEAYNTNPINSLIFTCHFFDQAFWRSPRVPLQVNRDPSFDPYHPQSHQQYNVAQDKLLANQSWTVTTNPFNANFKLMISPAFHRLFVEYLYTHSLEIEVWDGDSLFQLGIVRVPLQQFLRQGSERLERNVEMTVWEVPTRGSLFEETGQTTKISMKPVNAWGNEANSNISPSVSSSTSSIDTTGVTVGRLSFGISLAGIEPSGADLVELESRLANTLPSCTSSRLTNLYGGGSGSNQGIKMLSGAPGSPTRGGFGDLGSSLGATTNVPLNIGINHPVKRRARLMTELPETDPSLLAASVRGKLTGSMTSADLARSLAAGELSKQAWSSSTALQGAGLSKSQRLARDRPLHRSEILAATLSSSVRLTRSPAASPDNKRGGISMNKDLTLTSEEKSALDDDLSIRNSNLKKIRRFRENQKDTYINEMLRGSMTAIRTIYPTYGQLVFFELSFTNPYAVRTRFRIRIEDPAFPNDGTRSVTSAPECSVVLDTREWLYLKSLYGLTTPTALQLFAEEAQGQAAERLANGRRRQDIGAALGLNEDPQSPSGGGSSSAFDSVYIVLEGNETAYLPLKFQSFNAGHPDSTAEILGSQGLAFPTLDGTRPSPRYQPILHRILTVNVETCTDVHSTVAYLRVDVRPQMFPIDKTLRFHHWSDEILKGTIALPQSKTRQQPLPFTPSPDDAIISPETMLTPSPGLNTDGLMSPSRRRAASAIPRSPTTDLTSAGVQLQSNFHILAMDRIMRVNCSSDEVAFDFICGNDAAPTASPANATDIAFKVRVATYPSLQRFYLCLYTDIYSAHLQSVIEVLIYSHMRAELNATVGQRSGGKIYLPATDRVRRVQMSSSSLELTFGATTSTSNPLVAQLQSRSAPFMLQPGVVNTIDYVYHTAHAGKRSCLLHLLDADSFELLQSWCLFITATYPKVSNVFNITLKCGQGARKAFDYENAYKVPRTFLFESSAPDRLKLREELVQIPPLSVRSIHLVLAPQNLPGTDVIFVFINDEKGKGEECLQFNVQYKL